MKKAEKYLAAGTIVAAGIAATAICPVLAPTIKIATFVFARNALR